MWVIKVAALTLVVASGILSFTIAASAPAEAQRGQVNKCKTSCNNGYWNCLKGHRERCQLTRSVCYRMCDQGYRY